MNIERFGYKFPYLLFYANFPSFGYQNRLVDRVKFTEFFSLNAPGSRGGLQGLNPRMDKALTLQGVASNRIDSTGLELLVKIAISPLNRSDRSDRASD
ncbi:hypothetical protein [Oscillatoria sp. HE19RPO]|uniref:hypothetical protein n=1 Tax=Oscillatoria sp. HE19RPO TaxID=2954806 RepID=UPI0020C54038|nr:hypothetical protein [Oscillatoria sp. HE19RPO]